MPLSSLCWTKVPLTADIGGSSGLFVKESRKTLCSTLSSYIWKAITVTGAETGRNDFSSDAADLIGFFVE